MKRVIAHHRDLIKYLERGDEEALVAVITDHIKLFHGRVARYTSPAKKEDWNCRCPSGTGKRIPDRDCY